MPADRAIPLLHSLKACLGRLTGFGVEAWSNTRCPICLNAFTPYSPYSPDCPDSPAGMGPGAWLCPDCAPHMAPFIKSSCPLCARPHASDMAPAVPCGACLASPPPWEAVASYGLYKGRLKEVLLRFKYGEDLTLAPVLGSLLAQAAARLAPCDMVVPMPRHIQRLRERGFNQVQELARPVAHRLGMALNPLALTRTRLTQPQAALPAKERSHNPAGSFAASGVAQKRVLLLDDIMTTGATLRHAAQALRAAGADSVRVAVVARAVLD